jgi:chemotaxis protein MotB
MAKEKAAPAGAPAWMVTFADLMSLLVCFFVLIISFSVQDDKKMQVVSGSVRDAFGVSKDWQARALVEINGRPKTKNIKLPPHQNIVVFMPKPDIPPPDDVEDPSDSDSIPAAAAEAAASEASEELLTSAADFLELSDYQGDSLQAHVGDPGAEGGDGAPGAVGLAQDWREQFRAKQVEAKEERLVEAVRAKVKALAANRPELAKLARNLKVERGEDGVRIQLIDDLDQPMFPLGSTEFTVNIKPLLQEVARLVAGADNQVVITGHTDDRPYRGRQGYDNWNLSSDRAHATRRALIEAGVPACRRL